VEYFFYKSTVEARIREINYKSEKILNGLIEGKYSGDKVNEDIKDIMSKNVIDGILYVYDSEKYRADVEKVVNGSDEASYEFFGKTAAITKYPYLKDEKFAFAVYSKNCKYCNAKELMSGIYDIFTRQHVKFNFNEVISKVNTKRFNLWTTETYEKQKEKLRLVRKA
jgi:hypothetical protein